MEDVEQPEGNPLLLSEDVQISELASGLMPPWSIAFFMVS